jgi:molybdopterin converting factor small subunit
MSITVHYLGILAETTGKSAEDIAASGTKAAILQSLFKKYPGLSELSFIMSLNGVVTHGDTIIHQGDQITLIPPAPGG